MPESEAYKRGSEVRRKLLGDAYVDRANKTTYDDPATRKFIEVVTETSSGRCGRARGSTSRPARSSASCRMLRRGRRPSWQSTCAWRSDRGGPRMS